MYINKYFPQKSNRTILAYKTSYITSQNLKIWTQGRLLVPPRTLRMRLHPKLEGDEVPRLNPKVVREPLPEQRPRQMSSKYTLSWASVHTCAYGGGGGGAEGRLVEKHLRAL